MLLQTQASTIKTQASSLVSDFLGHKSSSNNPATVTKKPDLSQPIPVNSKLAATDPTPFTNNLTKLGVDRIKNYQLFYPQSWKPTLNPYATTVTKVIGDWLTELKIIKDEATLKLFQEERADLYGGYSYPLTSPERFTTITKFIVLWILFDDLAIETPQNYWQKNNLSLDDYKIALRDGSLPHNADPFLLAWWELVESFGIQMTQQWRNSFTDEFVHWARQSVKEYELYTKLRQSSRLPDLSTYMNLRHYTIGMIPTYYLIEYSEGLELPYQVRNHPVMKELYDLGTKIVILINDIVSLEKDMISSWPNAVTIIQQEYGTTLSDALYKAVKLHNDCVFSFIDVESKIPSFGDEIDPVVSLYLDRIHLFLEGTAQFHCGAERYQWKNHLAPGKIPFAISLSSFVD